MGGILMLSLVYVYCRRIFLKKWFSIIVLLFISFFCLGGTLKQIPSKKLRYVRSWLYQLQNLNLNKVADSRYNMVVMDYSSDGSRRGEYRQSQIRRLKASGKVVLAYLSIGEIENYRFYWRKSWKRTRPSWILFRNQGWAGNYLVRYWKSQWKRILFNRLDSYLYRIMKAGFDGVYLDRVDSYRFWKKRGMSSARQKMIDLVGEISSYVRRGGKGRRYIFVQNAPELAEDNQYLKYVDGI